MRTKPLQATVPADGGDPKSHSAAFRYVSRQPILDLRGNARGYELLFRDGVESVFQADGERATQTMIDNTVLFGLQSLTGGIPAWINCTAAVLLGDAVRLLEPKSTVLEILETVEVTPEVVIACEDLKHEGYKLALDDFVYRPDLEPLIRIADFIKLDYLTSDDDERTQALASLDNFKGVLVAEKVEDAPVYERAREEGCTLFQGFYFCRPQLMERRKVPANRHVHLRLLRMLQRNPLNFQEIDEIAKSEPSLAYRLLRYANSPVYGLMDRVSSIRAALLAVGDDLFRRIAVLAVTSEMNSCPSGEIVRMALARARFCEETAGLFRLQATEQFLLGLFSLLPAMLQKSMPEALADVLLREPLLEALLWRRNAHWRPLELFEAHERGDFDAADAAALTYGVSAEELNRRFRNAIVWADEMLSA